MRIASQEAAYWYIRLSDEREMDPRDRQLLLNWLKGSPMHIAEMLRIMDLDADTQEHRFLRRIAELADASVAFRNTASAKGGDADQPPDLSRDADRTRFPHWVLLTAWCLATSAGLLHLVSSVVAAYGISLPDEATPIHERVLLLLVWVVAIVLGWLVGVWSLMRRGAHVSH